ncbi:Avirulence (Avh) protein [Phytophthora megakarya]|uniref:RxLR effector protein n=1 Tax=Phytophthora megakarya TaxID=4795 RepID=A0A225V522_9STRA|nr:Avirulence (Avh) protein [Phytophthora megakarya]
MRLFQIAVVTVASFLLASETLANTPVSNHAKIQNVSSLGNSNKRFLRGPAFEYDNDSEERGGGIDKFSAKHQKKLIDFAAKLGFNLATGEGYSKLSQAKLQKYIDLYNKIHAKYH